MAHYGLTERNLYIRKNSIGTKRGGNVKKFYPLVLLFVVLLSSLALSQSCVYYFYGEDCKYCPEVNSYMRLLENTHTDLEVQWYEVYFDKENNNLLQDYFRVYNVPKDSQGLPVVFMSNGYFVGPRPIQTLLGERLKDSSNLECPSLERGAVIGLSSEKSPQSVFDTLTMGEVTKAAFKSSFNPGMVALIIMMLVIVLALKDREKMLFRGLIFIVVVYLTYFLYSSGLLNWFAAYGTFFPQVIGVLAIILGIALIKSFFGTWKVLLKQIPEKPVMLVKKLALAMGSSPVIVALGFFTTVWTFVNIDKTFLIMRLLFSDPLTRWGVFPKLLYYLFVLILPLLVVLLFFYFVKKGIFEKIDAKFKNHERNATLWKNHTLMLFNFALSVVLVVMGIVVLVL